MEIDHLRETSSYDACKESSTESSLALNKWSRNSTDNPHPSATPCSPLCDPDAQGAALVASWICVNSS
jgi:hypothetical protein